MKTAKVLLALSISAAAAATAAACSSSSTQDGGVSMGGSGSGSGGGTPSVGRPPTGTGGKSFSGLSFACGPSSVCGQPLTYCCVGVAEGGTPLDAAMVARDSASVADASPEAAKDSGEAGASNDSSAGTDTGASNDAAMKGEAGNAAPGGGGGAASSSGANGFVYHCSLNETTCPTGTSIAFGCAGSENCSSGQACCAEVGDGGFVAKCAPPPCASGKVLCLSDVDCRKGETCVPASDYGGSYSICVMDDGGLSEGGGLAESGSPGDGAVQSGRDSGAD